MKLKTRMTIDRPIDDVWAFFTTSEHWGRWWGGALTEVRLGWVQGGQLVWELGQPSVIQSIDPFKEVVIKGRWNVVRWTFNDLKGAVLLEMEEEFIETLPSSEAQWREDWQSIWIKLKSCLESGAKPMESTSPTPPNSATISQLKAALKAWYRERAKAWWSDTKKKNPICDDCNRDLSAGDGYLRVGNYLCCERCTDSILDSADWDKATQNVNSYFGPGIPAHIQQLTSASRDPSSATKSSKADTPPSPTGSTGAEDFAALLNNMDDKGAENFAAMLNQTGASAGTTTPAKTVVCRCCGGAKPPDDPACPHCQFMDWWIPVVILLSGLGGAGASLFWFETTFWIVAGWVWAGVALAMTGGVVIGNIRALRRHQKSG